jgi:hypothetical protein
VPAGCRRRVEARKIRNVGAALRAAMKLEFLPSRIAQTLASQGLRLFNLGLLRFARFEAADLISPSSGWRT